MEIRRADSGDIPGLIRLLYQVGEVHHQIRPDLFRDGAIKYQPSDLEILLRDESRPVFVAVEGDTVPGYCFCQLRDYRGSSVLTDRQEIYIDDLCLDAEYRGGGLAEALYRHVCRWAKDRGCGYVTLNVWQGNDRARRFYEKMGMVPRSVTMEQTL